MSANNPPLRLPRVAQVNGMVATKPVPPMLG
jgi:hypothetical protein